MRVIHEYYELGTVHPSGDFVPDYTKPVGNRRDLPAAPLFQTSPEAYTLPIDTRKVEPVYEYRSGRLIRGALYDTGSFAPEVGSTVIAFRDFDPATDTRRIYNLPGVLVRDPAPAPNK